MVHLDFLIGLTCLGVAASPTALSFGLRTVEKVRSLEPSNYLPAYRQKGPRLLLFDNNGCLRQKRKSAPGDLSQLPALLTGLCNDPHNEVWVVSGQDVDSLQEQYAGVLGKINLAAEHGSVIRRKNETRLRFRDDVPDIQPLRRVLLSILEGYEDVVRKEFPHLRRSFVFLYTIDQDVKTPGGTINPIAQRRTIRVKEMLQHIKLVAHDFPDYRLLLQEDLGHVEFKHKNACKGKFSTMVLGEGQKYVFGISVGDTKIDEEMHRIMNEGKFISVVVSKESGYLTNAQYKLQSFKDVHKLIYQMNNH